MTLQGVSDTRRIIVFTLLLALMLPGAGWALAADDAPYADIRGHWGQTDIERAKELGIMNGVAPGLFAPQRTFTRAELAACLVRVFELDLAHMRFVKEPVVADLYSDVGEGRWYAQAVMIAGHHGLLDATDRCFRPDEPVTRAETALAITRAFHAKKVDLITTMIWPGYTDIEGLSGEATGAVNTVFNAGIMKGAAGCFRPDDALTRAEAAVILLRTRQTLDSVTQPVESEIPPRLEAPSLDDLSVTN